jgi:broad specificity phosphatase PhoE
MGDVLVERHGGTVPAVLARLHLVRHGEVRNPDHVCYADLPGFDLTEVGRVQARAAGHYLAAMAPASPVATSPLDRAVQTAEIIAAALGVAATTDRRLIEWELSSRWAGAVWEELPDRFPGELEAYLAHPHDLGFSPESIAETAERMNAVVADLGAGLPEGTAILVSHQDPIQALRLRLLGRPLSELPERKPRHGEVLTLQRTGAGWSEVARWVPDGADTAAAPGGD